mgnify:FL=1
MAIDPSDIRLFPTSGAKSVTVSQPGQPVGLSTGPPNLDHQLIQALVVSSQKTLIIEPPQQSKPAFQLELQTQKGALVVVSDTEFPRGSVLLLKPLSDGSFQVQVPETPPLVRWQLSAASHQKLAEMLAIAKPLNPLLSRLTETLAQLITTAKSDPSLSQPQTQFTNMSGKVGSEGSQNAPGTTLGQPKTNSPPPVSSAPDRSPGTAVPPLPSSNLNPPAGMPVSPNQGSTLNTALPISVLPELALVRSQLLNLLASMPSQESLKGLKPFLPKDLGALTSVAGLNGQGGTKGTAVANETTSLQVPSQNSEPQSAPIKERWLQNLQQLHLPGTTSPAAKNTEAAQAPGLISSSPTGINSVASQIVQLATTMPNLSSRQINLVLASAIQLLQSNPKLAQIGKGLESRGPAIGQPQASSQPSGIQTSSPGIPSTLPKNPVPPNQNNPVSNGGNPTSSHSTGNTENKSDSSQLWQGIRQLLLQALQQTSWPPVEHAVKETQEKPQLTAMLLQLQQQLTRQLSVRPDSLENQLKSKAAEILSNNQNLYHPKQMAHPKPASQTQPPSQGGTPQEAAVNKAPNGASQTTQLMESLLQDTRAALARLNVHSLTSLLNQVSGQEDASRWQLFEIPLSLPGLSHPMLLEARRDHHGGKKNSKEEKRRRWHLRLHLQWSPLPPYCAELFYQPFNIKSEADESGRLGELEMFFWSEDPLSLQLFSFYQSTLKEKLSVQGFAVTSMQGKRGLPKRPAPEQENLGILDVRT